jgi:hypothetical protein
MLAPFGFPAICYLISVVLKTKTATRGQLAQKYNQTQPDFFLENRIKGVNMLQNFSTARSLPKQNP